MQGLGTMMRSSVKATDAPTRACLGEADDAGLSRAVNVECEFLKLAMTCSRLWSTMVDTFR